MQAQASTLRALGEGRRLPGPRQRGRGSMIEAAMLWNEPNNKSHWDPEVDPGWQLYGDMVKRASRAINDVNPGLTRVLGGMSPIDPIFVDNMRRSEEHTSELQSRGHLVCRLLLEKKNRTKNSN